MRDLSLKGVARQFGGVTGDFDVVSAIFGVSAISGTVSLRAKLEALAGGKHSFDVEECKYGWNAAYYQTWTHIVVRIRLVASSGLSAETLEALKPGWESGIETAWSGKWTCVQTGELPCRLSFEVHWVSANPYHTVSVLPGGGQTNKSTWHEFDPGSVAAHEFGHMLGNADEYNFVDCPDRSPVDTGTIMDDNSPNIASWHVQRFANSIGSNLAVP